MRKLKFLTQKQKLYFFVALLCAVTQGAWGQTIDLSTLTNNSSYTIPDGATLTGTLTVTEDKHCNISIAAGATITLSGVDINGQGELVADQAGLTCLGDATIILADGTTNTICPFGVQRPAVYIPEGSTLTIQGGGTLIGHCEKCGSAVIGGGYEEDCGSIVIDGGIIKAYGNKANLGNGVLAAAIGGGYNGDCGNITITSNITSLYTWIEVVREGLYCIGAGLRGDCNGVVTIGGQQLTFSGVPGGQGDDNGQVYDHEVKMYTNKVIFDSNGCSGTMNPQGIMNVSTSTFHPNNFNPAIHISNNNFSRHGYAFTRGTSGQPTEAYGAVVGINECILENNYYTACTVGGVENATGVGCAQYEESTLSQSDAPGALPALRDNADNTDAIALMDSINEAFTYNVCLNGRTLYKDGYWNTICLPFDLKDFTGTPLEGATVMQFAATQYSTLATTARLAQRLSNSRKPERFGQAAPTSSVGARPKAQPAASSRIPSSLPLG